MVAPVKWETTFLVIEFNG